ncbi:unnamed protein product [Macrosiphum euphorbiae]|uniref:Uncharacterized protein n=1 Tax=Macrosiphum euphorbiae TaxID=13131 RepID=A0AAV0WMB8_9HEMI|nr:unnamed protein product [Macrosiphum euphorbiae]
MTGTNCPHAVFFRGDQSSGDRLSVSQREHAVSIRSSLELSVRSPVYGAVKSVPPVAADESLQLVWKRSKRFVWKYMVNAARRICFCHSFVDLE